MALVIEPRAVMIRPAGGRSGTWSIVLAGGLAGQPQLWGLVAGEAWRRFKRRMRSGPIAKWRFAGRAPDRILIAPPDLRNADPHIAQEFYAGRYYLQHKPLHS